MFGCSLPKSVMNMKQVTVDIFSPCKTINEIPVIFTVKYIQYL